MDTLLFIEIILTEGAVLLDHVTEDGVTIEFYHGLTGNRVQICVTDEFITKSEGRYLLKRLGMESLIQALFP